VGLIVLLPQKDALLLDNVAIDPSVQGRGYGKKLIAFAEEHARKMGFRRIILYTNEVMTENLQLYFRLGYTETHRAEEGGFNRVFFSNRSFAADLFFSRFYI
jgi:GNAT superfamily N-acetyltransferase